MSAINLTAVSQPWPPQILHQALDAASGWRLSGTGADYECAQAIPNTVPCGPLAGPGARIVTIRHSDPFVLA